jgi:heptosyltransferase III
MTDPEYIIISRTDSIGDVVLTLPMAGILKKRFPGSRIIFLGKEYTRAIVNACIDVDEFMEVEDFLQSGLPGQGKKTGMIIHVFPVKKIARKARQKAIPLRIGTTNRIYHWLTCNKLVRLSRKNSNLHEAQLNLKLLKPLGISREFALEEIGAGFGLEKIQTLPPSIARLTEPGKYHLILHPTTQGSAREWGLDNFIALVNMLDRQRYQIYISGTLKEKLLVQPLLDALEGKVTDITGMMDLAQFISFIRDCDGMVANSTGPLHIAAALGKDAMGIYPPMPPIHPGRWAPLGPKAKVFVLNKECSDCRKNKSPCHCITEIKPEWVKDELDKRAGIISFS